MIRQLPARRALIIRGGYSPVVARLPMAWHEPVYRRARREHWPTTNVLTRAAGPARWNHPDQTGNRGQRGNWTSPTLGRYDRQVASICQGSSECRAAG